MNINIFSKKRKNNLLSMGCQVCSNKSEIKLYNLPLYENNSTRNLNYLFLLNQKSNDKKPTSDSRISSNQIISTFNILKTEDINYLETMRESMFKEINLIRLNPQIIEKKINKYYPFITTKQKDSFIQVDKNNRIKLNKGYNAFESCKNIISKKRPLTPLNLRNELTFPFPELSNKYLIDSQYNEYIKESYLTTTLQSLKEHLFEKNIEIVNFHYDIMNSNTELSVILQIVDDTNSLLQRRNNIFNKSSQYIGINIGKIDNGLYCYYLLFGKDIVKT